jgi:hypothetical protein
LLQNELKDAVTNHPELKEKSIQEGDVFSMFVDQRRMDMFVVSVWGQLQLTWKCLGRKNTLQDFKWKLKLNDMLIRELHF